MGTPEIWIEPLGEPAQRMATVCRALEQGFSTVLLDAPWPELDGLGRLRTVFRRDLELMEGDERLGPIFDLHAPEDVAAVHARRGLGETILLCCRDWKMIPLENLIADFQQTPTRVFAEATTASDARALLGTLEVGSDGVVLRTGEPSEVTSLARMLEQDVARSLPLVAGEVVEIRAVGMGDRVCIDTASLMCDGEGVLVGSQSALLALVAAETLSSGYVAPRPFRVNAGPVHAYTLVPGGKTRYLSELRAGDEILVVDRTGAARSEVVGRLKIERRPLLLVRFRSGDGDGSLLAQNAETVRLVGEEVTTSVAALEVGVRILLHASPKARHFGMAIDERISEE